MDRSAFAAQGAINDKVGRAESALTKRYPLWGRIRGSPVNGGLPIEKSAKIGGGEFLQPLQLFFEIPLLAGSGCIAGEDKVDLVWVFGLEWVVLSPCGIGASWRNERFDPQIEGRGIQNHAGDSAVAGVVAGKDKAFIACLVISGHGKGDGYGGPEVFPDHAEQAIGVGVGIGHEEQDGRLGEGLLNFSGEFAGTAYELFGTVFAKENVIVLGIHFHEDYYDSTLLYAGTV